MNIESDKIASEIIHVINVHINISNSDFDSSAIIKLIVILIKKQTNNAASISLHVNIIPPSKLPARCM